ncbi:hypothetical protein FRC10_005472 [Ceratobasidium sp. 414]|nr:hypothetical protein FRC10_005472 [Ceratobasidium sp. 414]
MPAFQLQVPALVQEWLKHNGIWQNSHLTALLQRTTMWNLVQAYTEFTYKEDASLLQAMPVALEAPEDQEHIDPADWWFMREVPRKGPGMGDKDWKNGLHLVKGMHSWMSNVWNVGTLSEDANMWILNDMVHANGKNLLKALNQYEADFMGCYKHMKSIKV